MPASKNQINYQKISNFSQLTSFGKKGCYTCALHGPLLALCDFAENVFRLNEIAKNKNVEPQI